MKTGFSLGFTHSRSYKDNNKWQNNLRITYFPSNYNYIIQPHNTNDLYYREVSADNFLFRIGKEYGLLFINRRTKKLYLGPSVNLSVLLFIEKGSSLDIRTNESTSGFSNFSMEPGIHSLLFMEYEYTPHQNSFFARLETGYLINPIEIFADYNGFPNTWTIHFSLGYRINKF